MSWIEWIGPALVGALASLVVAIVTTRAQLASDRESRETRRQEDRERLDREIEARLEAWKRDFAVRYAEAVSRGEDHARALGQQFAIGVLSIRGPGEDSGTRRYLPRGVTLSLGRSKECNIILDDPERQLSSTQAILRMSETEVTLDDVSTNGTFLNEDTAACGRGRRLRHGDRIRLGPYVAVYHSLAEGPPD